MTHRDLCLSVGMNEYLCVCGEPYDDPPMKDKGELGIQNSPNHHDMPDDWSPPSGQHLLGLPPQ